MRILSVFSALMLGVVLLPSAVAQTASQNVTVVVQEITAISVTGSVSLTINSVGSAGDDPDEVSASSSYNLTTNGADKKIVAELDSAFPTGITLAANMAAPSAGGSSVGAVNLSSSAQDLVTGITRLRGSAVPITYTASATVEAEPDPGISRTVTFTVTNS
ncbi:hypothetical protein BH23BAC4_BH23BAC4_08190 [soil metagenome]